MKDTGEQSQLERVIAAGLTPNRADRRNSKKRFLARQGNMAVGDALDKYPIAWYGEVANLRRHSKKHSNCV